MSNILHLKTMKIRRNKSIPSTAINYPGRFHTEYHVSVDYSGSQIFDSGYRTQQARNVFESFMTKWLGKQPLVIILWPCLDLDGSQRIKFQITMEGHDWNKEKLEPYMVANRK